FAAMVDSGPASFEETYKMLLSCYTLASELEAQSGVFSRHIMQRFQETNQKLHPSSFAAFDCDNYEDMQGYYPVAAPPKDYSREEMLELRPVPVLCLLPIIPDPLTEQRREKEIAAMGKEARKRKRLMITRRRSERNLRVEYTNLCRVFFSSEAFREAARPHSCLYWYLEKATMKEATKLKPAVTGNASRRR
ncbi:hypothetical protein PRIPAC_90501, partial [Pristionchus pacificus]